MKILIGAYNFLSEMNSLLHGNNECNSYNVQIRFCNSYNVQILICVIIKCSLDLIF